MKGGKDYILNMAELGLANKLILAFVALLVGVILIGSLATEATDKTEKTILEGETLSTVGSCADDTGLNPGVNLTITNYPSSWKSTDCPIEDFSITNSSGDALTETTDYTFTASTGVVNLENTSTTVDICSFDNVSLVNYTYCGDNYMNLSWGRSVINNVAGFFAIALLLTSVGLFYSVAKDLKII